MDAGELRRWIGTGRGRVAVGLAAFAIAIAIFVVLGVLDVVGEPATLAAAPVASPPPAGVALVANMQAARAPEAAAVSPSPAADDEVQMCGGAWVRIGADGQLAKDEVEALERRAVGAARAPALAAMEASADERAQAAAHFFQSGAARVIEECETDAACARAADSGRQAAASHRAALVRLAQGSADPQVYAWAYQSCSDPAPSSASPCQLITSEQWARLDASNAAPWLFMAAEAEKRGDASALDDAMFHVASAERLEQGWGRLPAMLTAHVPPADTYLAGALGLAIEAFGTDAASAVPYATATRYCSAGNLADANRRESCERVAELFVERSDTLLERALGVGMAKRLGWPPERIESIEEERDALFEASAGEVLASDGSPSCKELRGQLDRIRDIGQEGEVGSARRAIAASGTTIPLLAANYRKSSLERQEKARQEQAAASAASGTADRAAD